MIKKKYRGNDLEKMMKELENNFKNVKKEFETLLMRQKQRYAVNTLMEEYEITFSIELKKVRK